MKVFKSLPGVRRILFGVHHSAQVLSSILDFSLVFSFLVTLVAPFFTISVMNKVQHFCDRAKRKVADVVLPLRVYFRSRYVVPEAETSLRFLQFIHDNMTEEDVQWMEDRLAGLIIDFDTPTEENVYRCLCSNQCPIWKQILDDRLYGKPVLNSMHHQVMQKRGVFAPESFREGLAVFLESLSGEGVVGVVGLVRMFSKDAIASHEALQRLRAAKTPAELMATMFNPFDKEGGIAFRLLEYLGSKGKALAAFIRTGDPTKLMRNNPVMAFECAVIKLEKNFDDTLKTSKGGIDEFNKLYTQALMLREEGQQINMTGVATLWSVNQAKNSLVALTKRIKSYINQDKGGKEPDEWTLVGPSGSGKSVTACQFGEYLTKAIDSQYIPYTAVAEKFQDGYPDQSTVVYVQDLGQASSEGNVSLCEFHRSLCESGYTAIPRSGVDDKGTHFGNPELVIVTCNSLDLALASYNFKPAGKKRLGKVCEFIPKKEFCFDPDPKSPGPLMFDSKKIFAKFGEDVFLPDIYEKVIVTRFDARGTEHLIGEFTYPDFLRYARDEHVAWKGRPSPMVTMKVCDECKEIPILCSCCVKNAFTPEANGVMGYAYELARETVVDELKATVIAAFKPCLVSTMAAGHTRGIITAFLYHNLYTCPFLDRILPFISPKAQFFQVVYKYVYYIWLMPLFFPVIMQFFLSPWRSTQLMLLWYVVWFWIYHSLNWFHVHLCMRYMKNEKISFYYAFSAREQMTDWMKGAIGALGISIAMLCVYIGLEQAYKCDTEQREDRSGSIVDSLFSGFKQKATPGEFEADANAMVVYDDTPHLPTKPVADASHRKAFSRTLAQWGSCPSMTMTPEQVKARLNVCQIVFLNANHVPFGFGVTVSPSMALGNAHVIKVLKEHYSVHGPGNLFWANIADDGSYFQISEFNIGDVTAAAEQDIAVFTLNTGSRPSLKPFLANVGAGLYWDTRRKVVLDTKIRPRATMHDAPNEVKLVNVLTAPCKTAAGWGHCGTLYCSFDKPVRLAIHTGHNNHNQETVISPLGPRVLDLMELHTSRLGFVAEVNLGAFSADSVYHEKSIANSTDLTIVSEVNVLARFIPTNVEMPLASEFVSLAGGVKYGPPLVDGDRVYSNSACRRHMRTHAKDVTNTTRPLDAVCLNNAAEVIIEMICMPHERMGHDNLKPLDTDMVWEGDRGLNIRPVNISTAIGEPFTGRKSAHLKKIDGVLRSVNPELTAYVEKEVASIEAGIPPIFTAVASGKDESVKDGKEMRVFNAASCNAVFLIRKFLDPVVCSTEGDETSPFGIGLSMLTNGPSILADKYMPDPATPDIHKRVMCLDFKAFDKNVGREVALTTSFIFHEVAKRVGYTGKNLASLDLVLSAMTNPHVVINGTKVEPYCLCSGFPTTSYTGGTDQLVMIITSMFELYPELAQIDPKALAQNFIATVYGDDGCITAKPPFDRLMNQQVIQAQLLKHNIQCTDTQKNLVLDEYTRPEHFEFLKRGLKFDENIGHWVAPLAVSALTKPMQSRIKSKAPVAVVQYATSCSVRGEAVLHGEEFYNKFRDLCIRQGEEMGEAADAVTQAAWSKSYPEAVNEHIARINQQSEDLSETPTEEYEFVFECAKPRMEIDFHPPTPEVGKLVAPSVGDVASKAKISCRTLVTTAVVLALTIAGGLFGMGSASYRTPVFTVSPSKGEAHQWSHDAPRFKNRTAQTNFTDKKDANGQFQTTEVGAGMLLNSYKKDLVPIESKDGVTSLGEFLERKFMVYEFTVNPNVPYTGAFDPWEQFWTIADIQQKLNRIGRLKHGLRLTFVANTNMAAYGRLSLHYIPCQGFYDTIDWDSETSNSALASLYGFPTLELDLHGHCECSMIVPPAFIRRTFNTVELPIDGGVGRIQIRNPALLQNSLGSIQPVSVAVYASAVDVEYDTPMRDDANTNFTAEANLSAKVKKVTKKILDRTDTAIEIAQTIAGVMAILAGLSRKQQDEFSTGMFRYSYPEMAQGENVDVGYTTALQPSNSLTICPTKLSLPPDDPMIIGHVLDHEMFFGSVTWDTTDSVDTLVFTHKVTPMLYDGFGSAIYPTRLSHTAAVFRNWRGTLRFTYNVVASAMHRGILVFKVDPYRSHTGGDLHTSYVVRMDLSETRSVTLEVPWMKTTSWGVVQEYSLGNQLKNSAITGLTGEEELTYNGIVTCQVLTPLITTNDDTSSSVKVLCKVNGRDCEFANPIPIPPYTWESIDVPAGAVAPQPDEGEFKVVPEGNNPDNPDGEEECELGEGVVFTTGGQIEPVNTYHIDYMGEQINSIKSLCSRYSRYEGFPLSGTDRTWSITSPIFPAMPGYMPNALGTTALANKYNYVLPTHLAWFSKMYAFQSGSIRYYIEFGHSATVESATYMGVCRQPVVSNAIAGETPVSNITGISSSPYTWAGIAAELPFETNYSAGGQRSDNGPLAINFPYYTQYLATPCAISDNYGNGVFNFKKNIHIVSADTGSKVVRTYIAAGQDFAFYFPVGIPPIRAYTLPAGAT